MSIDNLNFSFIDFQCRDGILTVTLNRPEVLNALHFEAHAELSSVFDLYASDPNLRVAIITGAGDKSFCVGTDLKALSRTGPYEYPNGGFGGITKRFDLHKPVIAAVNGLCLCGGMEILAACDLAVASERAEFGLPEPLVGQAAVGGSALQRLARYLPMKATMHLALTAQRIGALEAQRIGLINEVVPCGEAVSRATHIAYQILACAPLSIEATKQVILKSLELGLEESIETKYPAVQYMLASEDAREGPKAFAEKRKPQWSGR